MYNASDLQQLRKEGISNREILERLAPVVPSAAKALSAIRNDKTTPDWQLETKIGAMLDKGVPKNAPSGLRYMNAVGLNTAQKKHDEAQAAAAIPPQPQKPGAIAGSLYAGPDSVLGYAKGIGKGIGTAVTSAATGLNEALTAAHGGIEDYRGPRLKEAGYGEANTNPLQSVAAVGGELAGGAAAALAQPLQPIIEPIVAGAGQALEGTPVADAIGSVVDAYDTYQMKNPASAATIEGAAKIASLPLAMQGAESTFNAAEKAITGIGKAGVESASGIATRAKEAAALRSREAVEKLAQPKMTQEEIFKAAKEGRAISNKAGEPTAVATSTREREIADALREAGINGKMTPTQAAEKAQKGIAKASQDLESEIAANNFAFNDKEAFGIFNKARQQAVNEAVITSPAEQKVFTSVAKSYTDKFKAILDKPIEEGGGGGNRLLAWHRTRIAMDKLAPAKTFQGDATMAAKVNAFRFYRDAMNDFTEAALDQGGSSFRPVMRYMSNLYRGLDNLETKAPKALAPTDARKALSTAKKIGIGAAATIGGATVLNKARQFLP